MALEPSDQELIERLRRRDSDALAALYDRYARSVYGLALYLLREPRAAEDVVQDVFLTLWQRPERYLSERGSFGPWLLRVAHNRAIDLLRRRGRERNPGDRDEIPFESRLVDPDPDPAEQTWQRANAARVRAALADLPEPQRTVIELAYFGGLTQRQMADQLGVPLGTIKTRVRSGLRRLAALLEASEAWHDRA